MVHAQPLQELLIANVFQTMKKLRFVLALRKPKQKFLLIIPVSNGV